MSRRSRAFEVLALPDLGLPYYRTAFGSNAYESVVDRFHGWLRLLKHHDPSIVFSLRYAFDPLSDEADRRTRLWAIVTGDVDHAWETVPAQAIRTLREVAPEAVGFPDGMHWCTLGMPVSCRATKTLLLMEFPSWAIRGDTVDIGDALFDTALDASPARERVYLDVRFRAVDTSSVEAALVQLLDEVNRSDAERLPAPFSATLFSGYLDSLRKGQCMEVLVSAGSPHMPLSEYALRSFAFNMMESDSFVINRVVSQEARHRLEGCLRSGEVWQPGASGPWYDNAARSLFDRAGLGEHEQRYCEISRLAVLASDVLVRRALRLQLPRAGSPRTMRLETSLPADDDGAIMSRGTFPLTEQRTIDRIVIGTSVETGMRVSIPINDLTKHAFVTGVTGSGKSVTVLNILAQLADAGVPFLVIEPAKTEFRSLARWPSLVDRLRLLTPGREVLNPLRINPFRFGPTTTLDEHVGALMSAFVGALPLKDPWPSILEDAVLWLYEENGWVSDDLGTASKPFPRMSDLLPAVHKKIDSYAYDPETSSTFKAAFSARLVSLTRGTVGAVFDSVNNVPESEDLFGYPTVLELAALTPEQSNLLTLFLLTALREHLRGGDRKKELKLLLVLEEAHNLVPNYGLSEGSSDDTKVAASRFVVRMLAEMRALGLGIVVVDQTPSAVASAVVKNTALKIAHRTVSREDRETLGAAMLLDGDQEVNAARLRSGRAFVYSERMFRPTVVECGRAFWVRPSRLDQASEGLALDQHLSDEDVTVWLDERSWYRDVVDRRIRSALDETLAHRESARVWHDNLVGDIRSLSEVLESDRELLAESMVSIADGQVAVLGAYARTISAMANEIRRLDFLARRRVQSRSNSSLDQLRQEFAMLVELVESVGKVLR